MQFIGFDNIIKVTQNLNHTPWEASSLQMFKVGVSSVQEKQNSQVNFADFLVLEYNTVRFLLTFKYL